MIRMVLLAVTLMLMTPLAQGQEMSAAEAKQVLADQVKNEVRGRVILRGMDYLSLQVLQSNHPEIQIGDVIRVQAKVPVADEAGVESMTSPIQLMARFIALSHSDAGWTIKSKSLEFSEPSRVAIGASGKNDPTRN